jgi:histone H3/H4
MGFISLSSLKRFINDDEKLRAGEEALRATAARFDAEIIKVLTDAAEMARDDKRRTVMERDIEAAIKKHLGKQGLTAAEVLQEVLNLSPTELGRVSSGIEASIRESRR